MRFEVLKNISPSDVAKYYLDRASFDGELISPLKMQKLVYYAYAWTLVRNQKKLFEEKIEAWPNGPVLPSLYKDLKHFGSQPIDEEFASGEIDEIIKKFPGDVLETIDDVYNRYMTKTAFELVLLTHNEKPWQEARKGLRPEESSNNPINDKDILDQFANSQ